MIDRITIFAFLAMSLFSNSTSWSYSSSSSSSLECQGTYSEYCFNAPASTKDYRTYDSAMHWCQNKSSQLAVISDSETQVAASKFLDSWNSSSSNLVYINMKLHMAISPTWYLTNGSNFYGGLKEQGYETYKVYDTLKLVSDTTPQWQSSGSRPDMLRQYICEFNGSSCSSMNNSFLYNGRCFVKYENDSVNWFEARKRCISDGGDLAMFNYQPPCCHLELPFNTSILNSTLSYWVGIRYNNLSWMSPGDTQNESMFYNWSSGKPDNFNYSCVCLNSSDVSSWSWTDCNCSVPRPFLCLTRIQTTTLITTTTTAQPTMDASKTIEHTNLIVGVVVGVGGGLIILVVVVIVVVCIIRKKRKPRSAQTSGNEDKPNPRLPRTGEYLDAEAINVSAANNPDKVPDSAQLKKENGRTIAKPTGLYGEVISGSGYSQDSLERAGYEDTTYDGLEFCDKNEDQNSIFKSNMQTMYLPEEPSHVYENYTE